MQELDNVDSQESIELIEIQINFCSICLNTENLHFTKLQCCGQTIHEKCLIEWFYLQNKLNISCPICRSHITNLSQVIPIDKFLTYLNNILSDQIVYSTKIKRIVCSLYNDPIVDCFRETNETIINISNNNNGICTCNNMAIIFIFLFISSIILLIILNIVNSSTVKSSR